MTAVERAGNRRRPRGTRGMAVFNAAADEVPARSGPAEDMAPGTWCCIEANRSDAAAAGSSAATGATATAAATAVATAAAMLVQTTTNVTKVLWLLFQR